MQRIFSIKPLKLLFILLLFPCFPSGLQAQEISLKNSLLATSSAYSIPENEVWKVMGDFGGGNIPGPTDSLSLVMKYSGKGLTLERINPVNLKGGMVMRETLPMWIAPGSKFSIDPGDLMEIYIEKYIISGEGKD